MKKSLFLFPLFALITIVCSPSDAELMTGIWHLADWKPEHSDVAEEFTEFREDGSFYGYQRIDDMEAELYGSYELVERHITLNTDSMVARQISTGEVNVRREFPSRQASIDVLSDEWLVMTWTDSKQKYRLMR